MKFNILLAPLVSLIALATSGAGAVTLEGQNFEERVRLVNREIRLNGLGVRTLFIIKGYVAGLYLIEKATLLKDVAVMSGPKRLQLRMLRSAGPDDFNSALVAGIRKNSSEAELVRLNERIGQLEHTIKAIGLTVAGDVINLDYVPDVGTTLAVNGVSKGTAIVGGDFFNAVLGIFIGDNPVDARLKQGLLGQ